jgi:hypothetical protein
LILLSYPPAFETVVSFLKDKPELLRVDKRIDPQMEAQKLVLLNFKLNPLKYFRTSLGQPTRKENARAEKWRRVGVYLGVKGWV